MLSPLKFTITTNQVTSNFLREEIMNSENRIFSLEAEQFRKNEDNVAKLDAIDDFGILA